MERKQTFDRLSSFLVDVPHTGLDGHHTIHLLDIPWGTVVLFERLPDMQQGDTLRCMSAKSASVLRPLLKIIAHLLFQALALQIFVSPLEHLPRH